MNKRMANLVLGLDIFYFLKKNKQTLILPKRSVKLISSTCSHFDWQHICYVWWTCFSTDTTHIGTNCSSSRQRIPIFAWGRFHTGSSQEKRTEACPILQFQVPLSRWYPFTIYFSFAISLIAYICPIELEISNKGNIKITELRTILQRESQNS